MKKPILSLVLLIFVLAACAPRSQYFDAGSDPTATERAAATQAPAVVDATQAPETPEGVVRLPTPTPLPPIVPPQIRKPAASIRIPNFSQSIPFDGIFPVYDPQFVNAVDAPLHPDELVIGIAIGDEAKAYPVSVLRFREMVNDELAGIPILVSW